MPKKETFQLPSIVEQAEHLIALNIHTILGRSAQSIRLAAEELQSALEEDTHELPVLLVPAGTNLPYAELMSVLRLGNHEGFIVEDFTDINDFIPVSGAKSEPVSFPDADRGADRDPGTDWYLLHEPVRGDEFENASPAEALAEISAKNRIPLTIAEGIFWAFQIPRIIERNHCFMTIGSRKPKAKPAGTFDARTPALWISNGTGRDGVQRKNCPKLGWCWWNNRHTWLGIAHAKSRKGQTGISF